MLNSQLRPCLCIQLSPNLIITCVKLSLAEILSSQNAVSPRYWDFFTCLLPLHPQQCLPAWVVRCWQRQFQGWIQDPTQWKQLANQLQAWSLQEPFQAPGPSSLTEKQLWVGYTYPLFQLQLFFLHLSVWIDQEMASTRLFQEGLVWLKKLCTKFCYGCEWILVYPSSPNYLCLVLFLKTILCPWW